MKPAAGWMGRTGGNGCFARCKRVLHVIRFNRSADVIQDVMGKHQAEVWVSDCCAAQLKAPAHQRQLCLAHQLRNLQAVVEPVSADFLAASHASPVPLCHPSSSPTRSIAS